MANLSDQITRLLNEVTAGKDGVTSCLFEAEDKDTIGNMQKENLKNVLSEVSKAAQSMLKKICASDEISSGEDLFDASKSSLSLMCISSALTGVLQALGEKSTSKEEKSESRFYEQEETNTKDTESTTDSAAPEKSSGTPDISAQHLQQFETVFKSVSDLAAKKMEDICASDEITSGDPMFDTKSAALAASTILSAIIETEKGSGKQTSEDISMSSLSMSPAEKILETLLVSLNEKEEDTLPWDKGPRPVKSEIDKRFGKDRKAIKGFLIRIYKHLKDPDKIKTLKDVLELYKKETKPGGASGEEEKGIPSGEKKGSNEKQGEPKKGFLKRHPIVSGYLGSTAVTFPFSVLGAVGGALAPGTSLVPGAAAATAGGAAATSLGASAGTAALVAAGTGVAAVGASVAGTALMMRGFYRAGKERGLTTTNSKGKEVGRVRQFARDHPLVTAALTAPVTLGTSFLLGGAYAVGKRAAKKAAVEKSLG